MITISDALKQWKAQAGIIGPIAELYDIEIDAVTTLRLVSGNPNGTGSVTFNGNVYTAAAIVRADLEQTIEGDLNPLRIAVSNIDGVAGGYIETKDLEGRRVTITHVLLETLLAADSVVETYTIHEQAYDRRQAVITLGHENLFRRVVPFWRFQRLRCQWEWEKRFEVGNGCNFPSDQFEDDTTQDLRVGGDTDAAMERKFGWWTLNVTKTNVFDVNLDTPGYCVMESSSLDIDWAGTTRNAPFLFKKLSGDFDVYTRVLLNNTRHAATCGILCQEDSGGNDSWVLCGLGRDDGEDVTLRLFSALNGVDDAASDWAVADHQWIRLARVGNNFTFYSALAENVSWVSRQTRTLALTTDVRLGLTIAGGGTTELLGAQFPYFRFLSGGAPTCDRTEDGADGCRVKRNLHRIFMFPGIPRR